MNRTNSLIVPQKRSALPLLLGLLIGSAGLAYGYMRWQRPEPPAVEAGGDRAMEARRDAPAEPPALPSGLPSAVASAQAAEPPAAAEPAGPAEGAAATNGAEAPAPVSGDGKGGGEAKGGDPKGGDPKGGAAPATATIKMDPLIANLDEGDQLRYLKLSVQLEVLTDAQQRIQAALPRARHEALMYMSGLHLADVQGMLGKQRVHRELQRRIADAVGSGLKRIYFDEFVVQ